MGIIHQTKQGTGLRSVSLNGRLAKRAVLFAACWVATWPLLGGVVINEIYYHPAFEDVREEFVELHNTGDEAVNLEGWSVRRGVRFDFPKATVPAHGYLVIAADADVFAARHPGVQPVVGGWDGVLRTCSTSGRTSCFRTFRTFNLYQPNPTIKTRENGRKPHFRNHPFHSTFCTILENFARY